MSRFSHTKASTKASIALLALALVLPACRKSPTTKQIKGFADKVCACEDAACAEAVQTEYLEWWKGNMRARGSEGDRKGVEKAMQRYAECHLALVGPESVDAPPPLTVPKVNLQAPIVPAPAPEAEEAASATASPAESNAKAPAAKAGEVPAEPKAAPTTAAPATAPTKAPNL